MMNLINNDATVHSNLCQDVSVYTPEIATLKLFPKKGLITRLAALFQH